jgi:hypothetical protein
MWRPSTAAFRVVPCHTRFRRFNSSKSSNQKTSEIVRKRTRKKYSELPTSYTLGDGSIATPLEPLTSPCFAAPIDSGTTFSDKHALADVGLTLEHQLKTTEQMNTYVPATNERDKICQKSLEDDINPSAAGNICERSGCHDLASSYCVNLALGTSNKPTSVLAVQIHADRERFPGCILLTRVGQFYEVRNCSLEVPSSKCEFWF